MVLGAGLEPACLSAYAPQTYVSAIPPPEPCSCERQNFPQSAAAGKFPLSLFDSFSSSSSSSVVREEADEGGAEDVDENEDEPIRGKMKSHRLRLIF